MVLKMMIKCAAKGVDIVSEPYTHRKTQYLITLKVQL